MLISPAGTPYTRTSLGQLIARIGGRAGISRVPVRPHIIRHTLNVIRRRAKIDPVTRSRLLTHTNLNSLHHYEHALDGELAAAREQQREGLLDYLSDYVPRLSAKAEPPRLNPRCSPYLAAPRHKVNYGTLAHRARTEPGGAVPPCLSGVP